MSHCLSHENKRDRMLSISPFWHWQDSAHFATPSFLTAHTFHIFCGSFQRQHSTWYGENAPVEKQLHRNLMYCSYSPWQQIIMLGICGEQGSEVSQLETNMIPRNMIKYFCFFFRLFVHFAIVVSKIAFKPSVTQSVLFDVPQGCSGCPYLFVVH